MFTGLSAFPLTPLRDDAVDEDAFVHLIERLTEAEVDSVTVLGSTGSYAYLSTQERAAATRSAVVHAAGTPVFVGIGALRTSAVLTHAENAQAAGASGLLLAPMSYQPLTEDEVFELFRTVCADASVPVVVYDNPGTTRFHFSDELYGRIAELPGIASIKIPPVPLGPGEAESRVEQVRAVIPDEVTIGISGDPSAAAGLNAGCDAWYSAIAGTLPAPALRIIRAAQRGDAEAAQAESDRLAPLWRLYSRFGGSLRVIAAIAEHLGLAPDSSLPLPLRGLDAAQRRRVAETVEQLGLTASGPPAGW